MVVSWSTLGVAWFLSTVFLSVIFCLPLSNRFSKKKIVFAVALLMAVLLFAYRRYDEKIIAVEIQNVGVI